MCAVWLRVKLRRARCVQRVRLLLEIRWCACLRMFCSCPRRQRRRRELRPRPGLRVVVRFAVLMLMRPPVRMHVSMSICESIIVPIAWPIPMFVPMSIPTPTTI